MKKSVLALAAIISLSSFAKAQENSPLGQLAGRSDIPIAVPAVPLPEKSAPARGWDPAAPFSSYQKQAEVISSDAVSSVIKNVRWGAVPLDGKTYNWETAVIKPDLLEKVYYGRKTAGAGHSLLVFVFKKGGFLNSRGEASAALTLGAESYTREPEGYSRANDLLGRYPIVWNLTTLANYADFNINVARSDVLLAPMDIPREAGVQLLKAAIARVGLAARGPAQAHNLFSNNCTTNAVALVNTAVPADRRIDPKTMFATNPDAAFPRRAVARYTRLGVLSPETLTLDKTTYRTLEISLY